MQNHYWFIFDNDHILLAHAGDHYSPLTHEQSEALVATCRYQHTLSNTPDQHVYCGLLHPNTTLPTNIVAVPLRKALNMLDEQWYGLAVKAYSVIQWDKNHQFCGRCSNPTEHKLNTFERICTVCKLPVYPRISPSIIVRIAKDDKILMARSPHFPPGAYGLIAGFVEAGENLEETIHREVKEEVGIRVKNIRYHSSQPWPFPDSLMVGFTADYAGGELTIDNVEIEHADWYSADAIPGWPSSSISISHKLINEFVMNHATKTQKGDV